MAWGGWGGCPSVPSPHCPQSPGGMVGGCGPLQSGSSPSIFLEGAEELVAMEMGKREEGCREILGSGRDPHLRPFESYILTAHKHIPTSMKSGVKPPPTPVTQTLLQTHRYALNSFTRAHSDV